MVLGPRSTKNEKACEADDLYHIVSVLRSGCYLPIVVVLPPGWLSVVANLARIAKVLPVREDECDVVCIYVYLALCLYLSVFITVCASLHFLYLPGCLFSVWLFGLKELEINHI